MKHRLATMIIAGCALLHTPASAEFSIFRSAEDRTALFRGNSKTGEASFYRIGIQWWKKINDPEEVPESVYEFLAIKDGNTVRLIRIDTQSGETWYTNGGLQWEKIPEDELPQSASE